MKILVPVLIWSAVLLAAPGLPASPAKDRLITMNVPAAVVAEAMNRVLPLKVDGSSSGLEGTLTIVSVTDFRIKDKQISCRLEMTGTDMRIVTSVADQPIRLKLGSATMTFDCDARLRFDAARQTLFIRPSAGNVHAAEALTKGDIGQVVLLLIDGREFPVAIQNLKPIMAETVDKIITLRTKIVDIRAVEGAFQVSLTPQVSTSSR